MGTEEVSALGRALEDAARSLVEEAAARGATVATAESLTAGLAAASIAAVPGASAVLRGGAVTYCDEVKHEVLGVAQATLDEHTAVSWQTACEMATGARRVFAVSAAVSLTGYAGPDGGSERDPAGTVYLATCSDKGTRWERRRFSGSRNEVRAKAALRALEMLLEAL